MKWLLEYTGNSILGMFLVVLTINCLVADWTLNPIWDIFFARVRWPIFYEVHASSILSICFVGLFRIIQSRGQISQWVSSTFATASLHELILYVFDLSLLGWNYKQPIGVAWQYATWLIVFLSIAILIGSKYQKRILFFQCIFFLMWFTIDIIVKPGSSINGFFPTAQFLNPLTNVMEVMSWLIPAGFWLIPQRWIVHD